MQVIKSFKTVACVSQGMLAKFGQTNAYCIIKYAQLAAIFIISIYQFMFYLCNAVIICISFIDCAEQ